MGAFIMNDTEVYFLFMLAGFTVIGLLLFMHALKG